MLRQFGESDLANRIDQCGSGIGHVMSMLLQVVKHEDSRVFLVDEPQSFLHPGALRTLLKIFEEYSRHQYIFTTHSLTAIMAVQNKTVLLVERDNEVSKVKSVNVNDNTELEMALSELGTRRSDIFGMDAVIWVAGKTDANCYKMIMDNEKLEGRTGLPDGVNILGLVNTGDLEDKKHAKLAVQIYQQLSGGVGLLPSVLSFVFDGDKHGAHEDLDQIHPDLIKYLPRQNYENYLIEVPSILADVLNEQHTCRAQEYTEAQVRHWIADNQAKPKFYPAGVNCDENSWIENINGARFIEALFDELSGKERPYNKVRFGPIITERILAQKPDHFQEIVDLITGILESNSTTGQT